MTPGLRTSAVNGILDEDVEDDSLLNLSTEDLDDLRKSLCFSTLSVASKLVKENPDFRFRAEDVDEVGRKPDGERGDGEIGGGANLASVISLVGERVNTCGGRGTIGTRTGKVD